MLVKHVLEQLTRWVFPPDWPSGTPAVLAALVNECQRLLPYLNAFAKLNSERQLLGPVVNEQAWVTLNWANTPKLAVDFTNWLYKSAVLNSESNRLYWALFNHTTNRIVAVYDLNYLALLTHFELSTLNKHAYARLNHMCSVLGNPWATVQQREVKGSATHAICVPHRVTTYA